MYKTLLSKVIFQGWIFSHFHYHYCLLVWSATGDVCHFNWWMRQSASARNEKNVLLWKRREITDLLSQSLVSELTVTSAPKYFYFFYIHTLRFHFCLGGTWNISTCNALFLPLYLLLRKLHQKKYQSQMFLSYVAFPLLVTLLFPSLIPSLHHSIP